MDLIKQFNLPLYVKGMSLADASKKINDKFKNKTDKLSLETKEELLSRLADAQEFIKQQSQQESQETSQSFAPGGELTKDGKLPSDELSLEGQGDVMSKILGTAGTAMQFGQQMFGKTGVNTSSEEYLDSPNIGMSAASSGLQGAMTGAQFGPIGAAIGGAVGIGAGLIGGNRMKNKIDLANRNKNLRDHNKLDFGYAYGGPITPPKKKSISDEYLNKIKTETGIPFTQEGASAIFEEPTLTEFKQLNFGDYGHVFSASPYGANMGTTQYNPLDVKIKNYRYAESKDVQKKIQDLNPGLFLKFSNDYAGGGQLPSKNEKDYYPEIPTYLNLLSKNSLVNTPYTKTINTYGVNGNTERTSNMNENKNSFYPFTNTYSELSPTQLTYTRQPLNLQNSKLSPNLPNTNKPLGIASQNVSFGEKFNNIKKGISKGIKGASEFLDENGNDLLRYAPVAMNAYQLAKLKWPATQRLGRLEGTYKPSYLDEKEYQNIVNSEMNSTGENIANSVNGSLGALRSNLLSNTLNKTKGLSDAYSKIKLQNMNEDKIKQEYDANVSKYNLEQGNKETEINALNKGNYDTQKSKLMAQMGTDLGSIGLEGLRKEYPLALGMSYDSKGNFYRTDENGKKVKMTSKEIEAFYNEKNNTPG